MRGQQLSFLGTLTQAVFYSMNELLMGEKKLCGLDEPSVPSQSCQKAHKSAASIREMEIKPWPFFLLSITLSETLSGQQVSQSKLIKWISVTQPYVPKCPFGSHCFHLRQKSTFVLDRSNAIQCSCLPGSYVPGNKHVFSSKHDKTCKFTGLSHMVPFIPGGEISEMGFV